MSLIIPQATVTAAGVLPRFKRFTVVGIFEVGMHEYDSALAIMHIEDAARIYQMKDGITGVRLRLTDLFEAPHVSREIVQELKGGYIVQDWTPLIHLRVHHRRGS